MSCTPQTPRERVMSCHSNRIDPDNNVSVKAYTEGMKQGENDLDSCSYDYATLDVTARDFYAYAQELENREDYSHAAVMRAYGRLYVYYKNGAR